MLFHFGRIPFTGSEVVDMDGHPIGEVLVERTQSKDGEEEA